MQNRTPITDFGTILRLCCWLEAKLPLNPRDNQGEREHSRGTARDEQAPRSSIMILLILGHVGIVAGWRQKTLREPDVPSGRQNGKPMKCSPCGGFSFFSHAILDFSGHACSVEISNVDIDPNVYNPLNFLISLKPGPPPTGCFHYSCVVVARQEVRRGMQHFNQGKGRAPCNSDSRRQTA